MAIKLQACLTEQSSLTTILGTTLISLQLVEHLEVQKLYFQIARHLDANYVLVIFGGMANYSGDDISKFLWMIRIAAGVFP